MDWVFWSLRNSFIEVLILIVAVFDNGTSKEIIDIK